MLWYLHLCADAGIFVVSDRDRVPRLAKPDRPIGKMLETKDNHGKFTEVILRPEITIAAESSLEKAQELHHQAHDFCFIANSVNFPILCQPSIQHG